MKIRPMKPKCSIRSDTTKLTVTIRNFENGPKISVTKCMSSHYQILYLAKWNWFDFTALYISYRYSARKILTV